MIYEVSLLWPEIPPFTCGELSERFSCHLGSQHLHYNQREKSFNLNLYLLCTPTSGRRMPTTITASNLAGVECETSRQQLRCFKVCNFMPQVGVAILLFSWTTFESWFSFFWLSSSSTMYFAYSTEACKMNKSPSNKRRHKQLKAAEIYGPRKITIRVWPLLPTQAINQLDCYHKSQVKSEVVSLLISLMTGWCHSHPN